MNRRTVLTFLGTSVVCDGLLSSTSVRADEPLPPPQRHQVTSPNGRIVGVSDPKTGTKILEAASGKELWSMAGWYRWLFVSNDGQHVATGYDGMNLIPHNHSQDLVLITFWERGGKVKAVSVRDLIPDKSGLKRTVSHYHWGSINGVNDRDELLVTCADGRKLRFKMATGALQ